MENTSSLMPMTPSRNHQRKLRMIHSQHKASLDAEYEFTAETETIFTPKRKRSPNRRHSDKNTFILPTIQPKLIYNPDDS